MKIDLSNEVEIWVENDTQISGGWCGGAVIAEYINAKGGNKAFAMTFFAYD